MSYSQVAPITHQRDVYPIPITALAFDPVSDTLWGGNNAGSLAAYHGQSRMQGVFFPVGDNLPVKKVTAGDQVRAVAGSGVGLGAWSKGGVNKWYFRWVLFPSPPRPL
jgi:PAB-dependent poly(A)-specific ribonuclease subunit 2